MHGLVRMVMIMLAQVGLDEGHGTGLGWFMDFTDPAQNGSDGFH